MNRPGLIERTMRQWRIVLTFICAFLVFGAISFATMPRQEFPAFTIRQGLVIGVMPGATSLQIEERLTRPLEQYLFSFQEVNKAKTYSLSQEGQVVVFVELDERIHGADAPAFWAKLRHGLNELRSQSLPAQVLALVGNNDFGDTSALLLTVVSEGHSPRDLEKQLQVLEDHLRMIPATSKLRRFGLQQEVIRITVDPKRLVRYGVRPATLWVALQGLAGAPASSRVDGPTLELPVHVGEVLRSEQALGDTILLSEPTGAHVRLGDVATVAREYGHDDSYVRYNGRTALVLSVEMQQGNDITRFGRQVDRAIEDARRELPGGVQITRVADQPKVVRTAVNHFMRDFGIAIVAVIAVTMLLLPLRVASVAAVTIPVSILITIGALQLLGVELQTVSLAGLVVVLGMVVDNAIVVVDDHVEKLDQGADPWTAAWSSARELLVPMLTATLAIIMAYVPNLWFLTGVPGDFAGSLPLTVAVALGVSLVLAVTLVPILDFWFIKRGLHRHTRSGRPTVLDFLDAAYGRGLERAFGHPALVVLGLGVGSVVAAGLLALTLEQQLFPKVDRNQFAVEVYLPAGRPLAETDSVVRRVEKLLLEDRRVVGVTAFVGTSSPRFHTLYAPNLPSRNYAQLIVNTIDEVSTVEVLREYSMRYAGAFPDAWVRWKQLDMQGSKAPVEIRLSGDDIPALKALGARLQMHALAIPGVTWVRDDFGEPLQGVKVVPDADACARLGVTPAVLQLSLAMGSKAGVPLGTVWEGDYPVRVILGEDPRHLDRLENLRQEYVPSALVAAAVPLEQLASVRPAWNEATIVRRNGIRTLTLLVDVAMGELPARIQAEMERYLGSLGPTPGIRVSYGGERQDREESYTPMVKALLSSLAIIYLILLFQFRRHLKALLVMITMPLGLLGAVFGLFVTRSPFGFTAFLGVISLMGIVVRNGIILVDYAQHLRDIEHVGVREAALAAGKRRMRPVFLTSAAAAVGVVPMIVSGSTLWAPLGAVTAFGLVFSMVLTLFVLPVAYWLVARGERTTTPADGPTVAIVLLLAALALPARAQEAPLTLDECRALATRNATEVRAADLEVTSAEETRDAAFTHFFPQLSASAMEVRSRSPLATIATPGGNLPVLDASGIPTGQTAFLPAGRQELAKRVTTGSVVAVQPLFAGGRIVNGSRLADLGVEIAREGAGIARRDAVAEAEEKYWRILQLAEKERTLTAYQGLLEALQRQADGAVQSGFATRNDSLKVSVQRQKAEVDRLRLESGMRLAARDLRRHLGLPAADAIALADGLAEPEEPVAPAQEREQGVDRRPEVRQLGRAVRAEGLQAALKRGEMLPSLSLGVAAMHNRVSGLEPYDDLLVFATVSVPLSGLWEGAHATAAQREKERIAETRLAEAREKIRLEIEKRWDDLWTAWRAVAVAEAAVEQAEVNLREERDRYQGGLVALSDLLEAQVLLHQAQDQRTDARTEYWLERSAYRRAIGEP